MPETNVMSPKVDSGFVDRRHNGTDVKPGIERRQFANNHDDLNPNARELALAIDEYKLRHRRRFISYEEIYAVMCDLGYRKVDA